MLMRFLPLIGGLLLTKGSRRIAGRHAGKLAMAFGAWELWRTYQATQPAATTSLSKSTRATASPTGRRRRGKKRLI